MTVTDTRKSVCPLCIKDKEQTVFQVEGQTYKGWACAAHLAALVEQAKPAKTLFEDKP